MTSPSRPLTAAKPSPTLFAAEYVKDFNATQAAIRTGYSERTAKQQGSRLLTRVDVQQLVAAASQKAMAKVEERTEEAIGSASWIVEKAGEVVNRALNAVPVTRMVNGHREIVDGEWTCNLGAATPALALLSKLHAEFSEKHEVKAEIDLVERRYIGVEVRQV